MSYNRYSKLIRNGELKKVPCLTIPIRGTDKYVEYVRGSSRLDNISYDTYNDANFDWLILLANQNIADLEYEIPDGSIIRVPYPLDEALSNYAKAIEAYDSIYGID